MISLKKRQRRWSPIGLDVGTDAVRAIQLVRSGEFQTVACASRCERRQSAGEGEGTNEGWIEELGREIIRCTRGAGLRGNRVVTALATPDVAFHTLDLPPTVLEQDEAEATQVVRWEVSRLMGDSPERIETRHWPLPASGAKTPNAIGVGAPHEVVTGVVAACSSADLVCSCMDTTATALGRLGELLNRWGSDQVWGVLDVGCRQTRLALFTDGVPVLVRTAGTGGRAWTQHIADSLQLSHQAAEIHKREYGIALTGRGVRGDDDDAPSGELASILAMTLRGDLNDIATEVKRSYEYVLSCYPQRHASDLVLVGAGAAMKNLPESLSNTLGIVVRRASSYLEQDTCRLSYQPAAERDSLEAYAVALGLAARG